MDTNTVRIRTRILRLLALGQGDGHEAASARARASELARRHGIDLATIKAPPTSQVGSTTYTPINSSLWRASLGWNVATYTGITMVRFPDIWHLIGRKEDVDTWRYFFERAEGEIDAEAVAFVAKLAIGNNRRTEGDTFRKGAADGFGERLARYRDSTTCGTPTARLSGSVTALVMIGRDLAVADKTKALFPRLHAVSMNVSGAPSTYSRGHAFGRGLGVHRGSIGGGDVMNIRTYSVS